MQEQDLSQFADDYAGPPLTPAQYAERKARMSVVHVLDEIHVDPAFVLSMPEDVTMTDLVRTYCQPTEAELAQARADLARDKTQQRKHHERRAQFVRTLSPAEIIAAEVSKKGAILSRELGKPIEYIHDQLFMLIAKANPAAAPHMQAARMLLSGQAASPTINPPVTVAAQSRAERRRQDRDNKSYTRTEQGSLVAFKRQ